MGRSIRYVRKIDEGFYRCLVEAFGLKRYKVNVLTFFEPLDQNVFSFENVQEFETEFADVESQELWLCRVDTDHDFYNRLTIKIPRSSVTRVNEDEL